jgi:hypothetical protein
MGWVPQIVGYAHLPNSFEAQVENMPQRATLLPHLMLMVI